MTGGGAIRPGLRAAAPLLAGALLLGGCCNGVTTDPRAGGLAGGACGTMTGAYEQRLAVRRTTLHDLDAAGDALERQLSSERADAAALGEDARRLRGALEADRRRAAALDADIGRARGGTEAARAELSAIKRETVALDRELAELIRRTGERERMARALREGVAVARDERLDDDDAARTAERRRAIAERLAALRRRLDATAE